MVLPEPVEDALGQLVRAAREGLLALSVSVGLGVMSALLEEEVTELVGPKGTWNADRTAVRHGHEDGAVTLGSRRVAVRRPRVRGADGESELPLVTYQHFAGRDPLGRVVLERMLAGVSTRKYRRAQEPVGEPVPDGAEPHDRLGDRALPRKRLRPRSLRHERAAGAACQTKAAARSARCRAQGAADSHPAPAVWSTAPTLRGCPSRRGSLVATVPLLHQAQTRVGEASSILRFLAVPSVKKPARPVPKLSVHGTVSRSTGRCR